MEDSSFPEQVHYNTHTHITAVYRMTSFLPQVRELALNLHRIVLDTVKMQEFQNVSYPEGT